MKTITFLFLIALCIPSIAQEQPIEEAYDFWVGDWKAEWGSGDQKGSGTNSITKILDGKVIQEDFKILEGANNGFLGTSISVYNPRKQSWHQAWADNNGGYYDFIGEVLPDKKIFKTKPIEKDGQVIIQRMVFYDIKEDSFTWDWEGTKDGGKTWNLLWRINYTRIK